MVGNYLFRYVYSVVNVIDLTFIEILTKKHFLFL